MQSNHLSNIIDKQNGATPASIVFIDIVSYSRRKTVRQQDVIKRFTDHTRRAFQKLIEDYNVTAKSLGVSLESDIIRIATGDGAAFAFPHPFNILKGLHLQLALLFRAQLNEERKFIKCKEFEQNNWCDCHKLYDVRIGISSGNVIIYTDLNNNFNVAGTAINNASRVMGLGGPQDILLTRNTYTELHDMIREPIKHNFVDFGVFEVKHQHKIDAVRYVGPDLIIPKPPRS